MKELGKEIQKLRLKKGYTQTSFSKAVGVSQSYLSKIERGILGPSCDLICSLFLKYPTLTSNMVKGRGQRIKDEKTRQTARRKR